MEATWVKIREVKSIIFEYLKADNDGLRTLAVKFMGIVVVSQTLKGAYDDPKSSDISLEDIRANLKNCNSIEMENEGMQVFQQIVEYHNSSHVSGPNLMTCIHTLTTIAKKRFQFFSEVLQAFQSLLDNMPPTLSQTQIYCVRKSLKVHLLILAKHTRAHEFKSQISIMLSRLGVAPEKIGQCFHPVNACKTFLKFNDDVSEMVVDAPVSLLGLSTIAPVDDNPKRSAINIPADDLISKFTCANISDLVLSSMQFLPDVMPVHFQTTYAPFAVGDSNSAIGRLALLLSTQMSESGFGKGIETKLVDAIEKMTINAKSPTKQTKTVVNVTMPCKSKEDSELPSNGDEPNTKNVSEETSEFHFKIVPLNDEESNHFAQHTFGGIFKAEKIASKSGVSTLRTTILETLANQLGTTVVSQVKTVSENPLLWLEFAFTWLYQEYVAWKGFENFSIKSVEKYVEAVNTLFRGFLSGEPNSIILCCFFLDLPCVTEDMGAFLTELSTKEQLSEVRKSMHLQWPPQELLFLDVMLDLTLHERELVRLKAVEVVTEIYENGYMKLSIEAFALRILKLTLDPVPEYSNFPFSNQLPEAWSDDLIKTCLSLFFALLPINNGLLYELSAVYVETNTSTRRTILQAIEATAKKLSLTPELLHFLENCPQGTETFVVRIGHALTEEAPPSGELVSLFRNFYHKTAQDVHFLLPIISELPKLEVISFLPEIIKLDPTVIKDFFHRIVGSNLCPLTPSELLVALHNIDGTQCDLKVVIRAISLCLEEKTVFNPVILAVVIRQLMDQNPLPVLLMRTVILSLAFHPSLLHFTINLLNLLMQEKVWNLPIIFKGFIMCCKRTKPLSYQVLLQLPYLELQNVLISCQDLREEMFQLMDTFTHHQKSLISEDVIAMLVNLKREIIN